ncbi:MAG: hypothetical protein WCY09_03145 [Candidatus Omnitrophota bacterium]
MKFKKVFLFLLLVFLVLNLIGCESFTRKFTRKSKKASQPIEMVLTPEEYKGPNMSKEELYRQYFLYWKSWQDELISAFTYKASLKKKVDCIQEALKNLVSMKSMLVPDAQKNFDPQFFKLNNLLVDIKSDVYGANDQRNLQAAERIKSSIQQDFIYPKIRNYLK